MIQVTLNMPTWKKWAPQNFSDTQKLRTTDLFKYSPLQYNEKRNKILRAPIFFSKADNDWKEKKLIIWSE